MRFWNGNKSPARQRYELALLHAVLRTTQAKNSPVSVEEDRTDYPNADDEGNIFSSGVDVLVTVAGNPKFTGKAFQAIDRPLAKGLLGQRLLIIRQEDTLAFASIRTEKEMKTMVGGIPATWADAAIYEANKYPIVEKGSFEHIFERLKRCEFDYVALGALEIEEVYQSMAGPAGNLVIESSLMMKYPMPLVFYVHPERADLARRMEAGLAAITENGVLDSLFAQHFGSILERLSLETRRTFHLHNPLLKDA